MELHIPRAFKVPPGESVVLAPIGDIQFTGRKHDIAWDALKRHIDRAVRRKAWFIGLGDYIDFASPSNRQRLRAAALYDTAEAVIADKARELVGQLYAELLEPTRGRWLGLVSGHHYTLLETGETSDQYLCQLLQAPFLGTSAIVGLQFPTTQGTRVVSIACHHGVGGGMTDHAGLAKLAQWAQGWEGIDLFLMGHTTKEGALPTARVRPVWRSKSGPTLHSRKIRYVNTGGWMRGYVEGAKIGRTPHGGYVEEKMLRPLPLGAPILEIRPGFVETLDPKGRRERQWAPDIATDT